MRLDRPYRSTGGSSYPSIGVSVCVSIYGSGDVSNNLSSYLFNDPSIGRSGSQSVYTYIYIYM